MKNEYAKPESHIGYSESMKKSGSFQRWVISLDAVPIVTADNSMGKQLPTDPIDCKISMSCHKTKTTLSIFMM